MIQIKIGPNTATLRNGHWTCDDPKLLGILQMFTSEIEIPGSTPDMDECIINGLRQRLTFTITRTKKKRLPDGRRLIF